jgi:hypothetical protein
MYAIKQGANTANATDPFLVRLRQDPVTQDPLDLTGVTAITTCFAKADGTELMLALNSGISFVGNPLLGKLLITITAALSALLAPIDGAELELKITFPGNTDPTIFKIPNGYSVLAADC